MLDYRHDRLDYGRMLISPPGYRLDRAVAATYSLNLYTLLSIPVALAYSQTLEGDNAGERIELLEAIRRMAGVLTVYCQESQIHVPDHYNRLFAFMEDLIVPVRPSDAVTSFHPKLWVCRYVHDDQSEQVLYRVLILSRNLTNDRSWDLAVCLEGAPGAAKREVNRPLVDFLTHLHGIQPIADFHAFTHGLAKAKLAVPAGFDRLAFHPMGIEGFRHSPIAKQNADTTLCMSPFLDGGTLRDLRQATQKEFWLFGRKREMEKLPPAVIEACRAYCLSDLIVEGERMAGADEGHDEPMEQDLHAKLFIFQQQEKCRWFLGSANATRAGHACNIEFMLELSGSDRSIHLETIREDLLGRDKPANVFEEFTPDMAGKEDAAAEKRALLRRLEFQLVQAPLRGAVVPAGNATNYDLTVSLDLTGVAMPSQMQVALRPLNCEPWVEVRPGQLNSLVFANIAETELSRFVALRLASEDEALRNFLVRYEIAGLPDSRLDTIFKRIVSSREKFFAYLRLLLADEVTDEVRSTADEAAKRGRNEDADGFLWHGDMPIFESLIMAASRHPARLKAVDGVIERLKTSHGEEGRLIPPEFLDFWDVFRPLIPASSKKGTLDE